MRDRPSSEQRIYEAARCFASVLLLLAISAGAAIAEDGASVKDQEFPSFVVAGMRVMPKRWDKKHNFGLIERYARRTGRDLSRGGSQDRVPSGLQEGLPRIR